jgi:hypothetical protein
MYTASHQRFVTLDEMMTYRLERLLYLPVFYLPVFYLLARGVLPCCHAPASKGNPQPLGDEIITMTKPIAHTPITLRHASVPRRFFASGNLRLRCDVCDVFDVGQGYDTQGYDAERKSDQYNSHTWGNYGG